MSISEGDNVLGISERKIFVLKLKKSGKGECVVQAEERGSALLPSPYFL